jgi:hypothetical protein
MGGPSCLDPIQARWAVTVAGYRPGRYRPAIRGMDPSEDDIVSEPPKLERKPADPLCPAT